MPPLTEADRQWIRYGLTDLLDDLEHADDNGEAAVIANYAWRVEGEATLKLNDLWSATGKWLLRGLRDYSPAVAAEWLAAQADQYTILDYGRRLLARHGGLLLRGTTRKVKD